MERPLFSEILGERRRELGYSIGQASRVLRLREDVLIAFEQGDFEQMPKSGYAQGMISSYARYLGLDPNEVVDLYLEDLEAYRRGELRGGRNRRGGQAERRSQSPSVGQSYVPKRGLLPTSGGMAGDLGSFATTRVRSRDTYSDYGYQDDEWEGERDQSQEYDQEYAQAYSQSYPQGRPYTGRTPSSRRRGGETGRRSRNRGDIETMRPSSYGYEDDLRFGRDVRSYEAASTGRGRRPRNGSTNRERPSVRRRPPNSGSGEYRDGRRAPRSGSRSGSRGNRGPSRPATRQNRMLLVVAAAVLILSIVVIFSVVSCVRQGSDDARTVPVSAMTGTNEQSSAQGQQGESGSSKESGSGSNSQSNTQEKKSESSSTTSNTNSSQTGTGKNSKTEQETSVSVSVADGAVTWLEIQCDGKSDVAETVTGPWQKTYTVNDVMTIQAGDTKSVAVVQNGRQVQFESITAGIGTLRIQGTKSNSKKDGDSTSTNSKDSANSTSSNGSNAKIGASSEESDTDDDEESTANEETVTVDGVTYDVYGNIVNTEGGTTSGTSSSSGNGSSSSKSSSSNGY